MNTIKVALNISSLSVPELIKRGFFHEQRINDNSTVFASCVQVAADVGLAATALQAAETDTKDGARHKIAIRNDKEKALIALLQELAYLVQKAANGDEAIVHLAGMELRQKGTRTEADFKVTQGEDQGSVILKAKSRPRATFKWQYCADPLVAGRWLDAKASTASRITIGGLAPGMYWFRVIITDRDGEHTLDALRFAVN
jgi:hypothetical protein